MGKEYKHWNDKKHKGIKVPFKTGDMADEINRDFIRFLLNDFDNVNLNDVEKRYVGDRFEKMISHMEDICYILRDAWSIKRYYGVDYEQRRARWIAARGYCFRLMSLLDNLVEFIPHIKNKQKYVDISDKLSELAEKIQNIIASDDQHKKKNCKQYMGNG